MVNAATPIATAVRMTQHRISVPWKAISAAISAPTGSAATPIVANAKMIPELIYV
jgi:hypothetical protein